MRFKTNEDKKLQSNLRTLLLCSRFKSVKIANLQSERLADQINFINREDNFEYRLFLEQTYIKELERTGAPHVFPIGDQTLARFVVPKEYKVPDEISEQFKAHQEGARKLEVLAKHETEQEELRAILHGHTEVNSISRKVDLKELRNYLNDKNHTLGFRGFADNMQKSNPYVTLLRYKTEAARLAKTNGINNLIFADKLKQTFSLPDVTLGLNKEIKGRFIPAGAKVSAIALVGLLSLNGLTSMFRPAPDVTQGNTNTHSSYTQEATTEAPDDSVIIIDAEPATTQPEVAAPISNSININSYDSAAKDFMQKTSEVYAFNTAENIDLSRLGYDNFGTGSTTILTATLGDKTLRFSSMSGHPSNPRYLEQALKAAGAEITDTYTSKITWITNQDGQSIAITDASGNAIRSGKVLEGTNSRYNQSYIKAGKQLMQDAGIDTAGKSEAELLGYYLFNGPAMQNDELSRALGETQGLASYMKTTFWVKDNKEDTYAISQYKERSHKFAENFNNRFLGIDENSNSTQTKDDDGMDR